MKLKDLKEYKLKESKQASYISILDKDPVYAARALTIKELGEAYSLLKKVFEDIRDGGCYYEPLQDTVLFCRKNFLWFCSFFKEMEVLLKVEEFQIPYEKTPPTATHRNIKVFQPFYCEENEGELNLVEYPTNVEGQHFINNYRVRYILECYGLEDFQNDSFPVWYLIHDVTVFEQYSEKTNTRVRVDFREGRFLYFIAGASDKWQQIEEVPVEMDHVIAALLFRRG